MTAWQTIGVYFQYGNSRGNLCHVSFKFILDTPQKALFLPKKETSRGHRMLCKNSRNNYISIVFEGFFFTVE